MSSVRARCGPGGGLGAARAPRCLKWPHRVFSQVLLIQMLIMTGVVALATGLFLAPLSKEFDDQAMSRALAIAQTVAKIPDLGRQVQTTEPMSHGPVQAEAEQVRRSTGAEYVVIMNQRGIRWSHTNPWEIGRHVSTDARDALAGSEVMAIDEGTLGRSARGKVPLRDDTGRIVGAVSVGIAYESVHSRLIAAIPDLLTYAGVALALGSFAAYVLARYLQRGTHDLAFADISALLTEREAMLHGIREGFIALDGDDRIRLMNDEALRLLDLGTGQACRHVDELPIPERTADVLTGRVHGSNLLTVCGRRVLVANRMPTDDGGAVITLRDRTELEQLARELDGTQGLLEALRSQDHEHANCLHTVLGLLGLKMYDDAMRFVTEAVGVRRLAAKQIAERVQDPLLAALLVGKATVAGERDIALHISMRTCLPDRLIDPRGLVTLLGNLVDNALDAASESHDPQVEVELSHQGETLAIKVKDSGPGVPDRCHEKIFTEGGARRRPRRVANAASAWRSYDGWPNGLEALWRSPTGQSAEPNSL